MLVFPFFKFRCETESCRAHAPVECLVQQAGESPSLYYERVQQSIAFTSVVGKNSQWEDRQR